MGYDIISGTEAAYVIENKELPFISCKCITYGRTDLLVESLHSFLLQDYPKDKCELVIVNDYPLQKLHYPHPQVRIYNLDETFPLIGEKENYAIERCKGPLIAVWDDDDVPIIEAPMEAPSFGSFNTEETESSVENEKREPVPLPDDGLPEGWSEEQWLHYGHQYLEMKESEDGQDEK